MIIKANDLDGAVVSDRPIVFKSHLNALERICMDKAISICVIPKLNSLLEDALCNFQITLVAYNSLEEAQRALSEGHFSLIVIDASTLTIERTRASVEHIRLITNAPIMILVPSEAAGSLLKAGADICISDHAAMDSIISHALALLRRYTQYNQDSTLYLL